jgi:cytolysin-activating lysine-acyltransferase
VTVATKDKAGTKTGNGAEKGGNGAAQAEEPAFAAAAAPANPQLDPEIVKKIAQVRSHVRESFGKVVMAMMMLPRYRNQTLGDLQHLVLEPLIRDRIAIAYPGKTEDAALADITGVALWASVSGEVDGRIREQIAAGTFPVRLKAEDWNSGDINWLLDVIAPDQKTTASVIANFKQVVKEGGLRLHPLITKLVDEDTLKKMGAEKIASAAPAAPATGAVN